MPSTPATAAESTVPSPSGTNAFGSGCPRRVPLPAATMMTAIVGVLMA